MSRYHEKYKDFYNSCQWKELRRFKFSNVNGLCEECLKKGIIKKGKEVHHIIPIEEDWSKRYDYDNLILLCKECHNSKHNRISPLKEFLKKMEDSDGRKKTDNNKRT